MADALTRRFQQTIARIGERAGALTALRWSQLDTYDEADVETFARAVAPTLAAVKASAVSTGAAYYAVRGRISRPPTIRPDMIDLVADPREPFIAYWRALKMGNPVDEAVLSGTARAGAIARNLASSASRRAGDVLFDRAAVTPARWVRVPDGGACDWCQEVAGQSYLSAESADFGHDRCNCTAEPEF